MNLPISYLVSKSLFVMVEAVLVTPEVWWACWSHVLTTQTEEVM